MIYVLHFATPLAHARHYVGFTKARTVDARVAVQLEGGHKQSPLVRAALAAGIEVVLAASFEGSRDDERALKKRKNAASFCPLCRAEYNARAAARMRESRARAITDACGQRIFDPASDSDPLRASPATT